MNKPQAISVHEITSIIKNMLEDSFTNITIEGEISNWKPSSSGHIYFTLKDNYASIQAVLFRGRNSKLTFTPSDGLLVRASGNISVYQARGQYQIIVEHLEQAGSGDILAMLEERKKKLAAEGLFDAARKPALPFFPERVAVITSPTGAALHDILSVLRRRNSGIRITILPAVVQGDGAASSLVRQLQTANKYNLGDVIILGRGGGSLEDMLAFSDEAVVRAVAASTLPVISAVGHEIDFCLADYAASLRAATPSAAAELVSDNVIDIVDRINIASETIRLSLNARITNCKMLTAAFSQDNLALRLEKIINFTIQHFDDAREALLDNFRHRLLTAKHRYATSASILNASNPMAILQRGFAVVQTANTKGYITDASTLAEGQDIFIRFSKGEALAKIKEIKNC